MSPRQPVRRPRRSSRRERRPETASAPSSIRGLRLSPTRARRARTLATAFGCLGPVLLLLGAAGFAGTFVIQTFAASSNLPPFTVSSTFLVGDAVVLAIAVVLLVLWGTLTYALEHGRPRDR